MQMQKGWELKLKVNPIKNKDIRNKIELLLKTKSKRNYLLYILGTNTALRIGDILKLTVADVKGNRIIVKEQKTGKIKSMPINAKLKEVIRVYTKGMKDTEVLFKSRKGVNKAISRIQAYRIMHNIGKMFGLAQIGSHSLRKTFAYVYYKATKDIATLMQLLKHSSEKITLRYIGIEDENLDNAYMLVAEL